MPAEADRLHAHQMTGRDPGWRSPAGGSAHCRNCATRVRCSAADSQSRMCTTSGNGGGRPVRDRSSAAVGLWAIILQVERELSGPHGLPPAELRARRQGDSSPSGFGLRGLLISSHLSFVCKRYGGAEREVVRHGRESSRQTSHNRNAGRLHDMTGKPTFEATVSMHGNTVLHVCRAVVGVADADDAWSETFLSAMRAYPDLPADANIEAWLVTIAHRKGIDVIRKAARTPFRWLSRQTPSPSSTTTSSTQTQNLPTVAPSLPDQAATSRRLPLPRRSAVRRSRRPHRR